MINALANVHSVDHFLVEHFGENNSSFIKYKFVFLHTNHMLCATFQEDLPYELRVACCYKDNIQVRLDLRDELA